jgi:transposase
MRNGWRICCAADCCGAVLSLRGRFGSCDLTRWRVHLLEDANRVQNRLAQVLEDGNIKLGAVVTDILGVSGRRMIRGLIEGKRSAGWMADLGWTQLKRKRKELKLALEGTTNDHHRWLMRERLQAVEEIEARVERVEVEIRRRVAPYQELMARLDEIPGVDEITCWTLIAELGCGYGSILGTGAHG